MDNKALVCVQSKEWLFFVNNKTIIILYDLSMKIFKHGSRFAKTPLAFKSVHQKKGLACQKANP